MGYMVARFGTHVMRLRDYALKLRAHSSKKEYYQDKTLTVEYERLIDNEWKTELLRVPLTKFGKIVQDKKTKMYSFEWNVDMHRVLFQELKKHRIEVKGNICVPVYHEREHAVYYLTSPLLDNDVVLRNKPESLYVIDDFSQIEWIRKNYSTLIVNEKGIHQA